MRGRVDKVKRRRLHLFMKCMEKLRHKRVKFAYFKRGRMASVYWGNKFDVLKNNLWGCLWRHKLLNSCLVTKINIAWKENIKIMLRSDERLSFHIIVNKHFFLPNRNSKEIRGQLLWGCSININHLRGRGMLFRL